MCVEGRGHGSSVGVNGDSQSSVHSYANLMWATNQPGEGGGASAVVERSIAFTSIYFYFIFYGFSDNYSVDPV